MQTTEWQGLKSVQAQTTYLRTLVGKKVKYALNKEVGPIIVAYDDVRDEDLPIPWHETTVYNLSSMWGKPGVVVDNDTGIMTRLFSKLTKTFDEFWDIQPLDRQVLYEPPREGFSSPASVGLKILNAEKLQIGRDAKAWRDIEPNLREWLNSYDSATSQQRAVGYTSFPSIRLAEALHALFVKRKKEE